MPKRKRDATPEETERGLLIAENRIDDARERQDKAVSEGYKSEVCLPCGAVFLAFHHFTNCPRTDCPMKDGCGSLMDRMTGGNDE